MALLSHTRPLHFNTKNTRSQVITTQNIEEVFFYCLIFPNIFKSKRLVVRRCPYGAPLTANWFTKTLNAEFQKNNLRFEFLDPNHLWLNFMESNTFRFHPILGPISEVWTHKQASNQTFKVCKTLLYEKENK